MPYQWQYPDFKRRDEAVFVYEAHVRYGPARGQRGDIQRILRQHYHFYRHFWLKHHSTNGYC